MLISKVVEKMRFSLNRFDLTLEIRSYL